MLRSRAFVLLFNSGTKADNQWQWSYPRRAGNVCLAVQPLDRLYLRGCILVYVKKTRALRCQQPLVSRSGVCIAANTLHVDLDISDSLGAIDDRQDVLRFA